MKKFFNRINFKDGEFCTLIGVAVNLLLTIFKFLAGVIGKSQAMIADSLHSLSDGVATISVYFGIRAAQKPADEEHPYGHGNIEVVVAIFVAVLLVLTGVFLGYSAIHSIVRRHFSTPDKIAVVAAVISILVKEVLYRYTYIIGKNLNSPAIIANARDHRSDAFSSIGSLTAVLGARVGFVYMDAVGGIVISFFILKMGVDIINDNIKIVMDALPGKSFHNEINNKIISTEGVKDTLALKIHPVGRNFFLEITVSVDKNLTVEEGHKIAEVVKETLLREWKEIKDVNVHIEPD